MLNNGQTESWAPNSSEISFRLKLKIDRCSESEARAVVVSGAPLDLTGFCASISVMATPLTEVEKLSQVSSYFTLTTRSELGKLPYASRTIYPQEREKYVKLVSSDEVVFIVEKKAASVSSTIKQMLNSDGTVLTLSTSKT